MKFRVLVASVSLLLAAITPGLAQTPREPTAREWELLKLAASATGLYLYSARLCGLDSAVAMKHWDGALAKFRLKAAQNDELLQDLSAGLKTAYGISPDGAPLPKATCDQMVDTMAHVFVNFE